MILGIKFRFRPEIQFLDDFIENSGRFPQISLGFPQISLGFGRQISPRFPPDFTGISQILAQILAGWLAGLAGWGEILQLC